MTSPLTGMPMASAIETIARHCDSWDSDAASGQRRRLSALMMVDVVGSTELIRSDERAARDAMVACWELLRRHAEAVGGRVVDNVGDNMLLDFSSVVCALAVARASLEAVHAEVPVIRLRIGIHVGDVLVEGGSFFGDAISLAARIQSLAGAGEILVSAAVVELVGDRAGSAFRSLGRRRLKHIDRSVRVYRFEAAPKVRLPIMRRLTPGGIAVGLSMLMLLLTLGLGLHIHEMLSEISHLPAASSR